MKTKCEKCDQECETIEIEEFDWDEFWGAPIKRYYTEEYSECCNAEVYEDE